MLHRTTWTAASDGMAGLGAPSQICAVPERLGIAEGASSATAIRTRSKQSTVDRMAVMESLVFGRIRFLSDMQRAGGVRGLGSPGRCPAFQRSWLKRRFENGFRVPVLDGLWMEVLVVLIV